MTRKSLPSYILTTCALGLQTSSASADPASEYPKMLREIPSEFRGVFDESGYCGRETRYRLEARQFYNFEASYAVLKVVQTSPNDIVLHTRVDPEHRHGKRGTDQWTFKLIGNGDLAGRDGKPPHYIRCKFDHQQ